MCDTGLSVLFFGGAASAVAYGKQSGRDDSYADRLPDVVDTVNITQNTHHGQHTADHSHCITHPCRRFV